MPSASGLYERRVFPWLNDKLNCDPELVRLRAEAMVWLNPPTAREDQPSSLTLGLTS
jgi:hypothetical protein